MTLVGIVRDDRHGLAAVDYTVTYAVNTWLLAELYARALIWRFRWLGLGDGVVEYAPGIVHLPLQQLSNYEETVRRMQAGEHPDLCQLLNQELQKGLFAWRRALWYAEHGQMDIGGVTEAATRGMAFFNWNDAHGWIDVLRNVVPVRLWTHVLAMVEPAVTPYLWLLGMRAHRYFTERGSVAAARFVRVAYLVEFDPTEDLSVEGKTLLALATRVQLPAQPGPLQDRWDTRRQRRTKAVDELRSSEIGLHAPWWSLAVLTATAADHEEARHVWQSRTMQLLRQATSAVSQPIQEVKLDDLRDSVLG